MSPDKIQTISDWPEPCKVKDIQSFLGFANFYRHFIFNYSDIVVPLTRLIRKDAPWNFSEPCHQSFNALKKAFTTAPILTHFILDTPTLSKQTPQTTLLLVYCPLPVLTVRFTQLHSTPGL